MDYREVFRLKRRAGVFDTEKIFAYLDGLPNTVRMASDSSCIVIAADAKHLGVVLTVKRQTGDYGYSIALVAVAPDVVEVWNAADESTIGHARDFLQWMLDHYDCTITDEDSVDVTDLAKGDAANLYPDWAR